MGKAMDGNLLKDTAEAHHKAIGSIDAKGVTSAADYEVVNAALGRAVASVPTSKVMDVYSAWAGILNEAVPNELVSTVNPLDAQAAAKAFYEFKDVVKAAQRCEQLRRGAGPLQGDPLDVAGRAAVGAHCPTPLGLAACGARVQGTPLGEFLPDLTGTLLT